MDAEQVPVLIVGAGGGGLSLSLLLLQQGIRPLLIERRADISWYPRARNLNFRTLHGFPSSSRMFARRKIDYRDRQNTESFLLEFCRNALRRLKSQSQPASRLNFRLEATLQEILENGRKKSWQTFGRLRLKLNQFIQRERDFSSRSIAAGRLTFASSISGSYKARSRVVKWGQVSHTCAV